MTDADRDWPAKEYPGLEIADDLIRGRIKFIATYNETTRRFVIVRSGRRPARDGLTLTGEFDVRIEGQNTESATQLPLVFIDGPDKIADRHFNQTDFSACLCNPLESDDYLLPEFNFLRFLEELVIPFLYGQVYFDSHEIWPWPDYSHGAAGLLEAYFRNNDPQKAAECIARLSEDRSAWRGIRDALLQKKEIKGHLPCFCTKHDKFRRCHPEALKGLKQLRIDVRSAGIKLP
jgi:hypothetical protein